MQNRIAFLDYTRVLACFMVIMVHSCEFYFIDGDQIGLRSADDALWVSLIDSAFRCSVPLFVMISGWLLLPTQGDAETFYRRRTVRVVLPFAMWSLLYVLLPPVWGGHAWSEVPAMLSRLLSNFNDASGHFWFVYMLVGLYLFMPVLSPWLKSCGRRDLRLFLALWLLSTFFPYLRLFCGDLYGECYWNEFNLLWYFSGFAGYLLLAVYVRDYIRWPLRKSLAVGIPCIVVGYAVTAVIWYSNSFTATTLPQLELSWRFCTPNVVLLTFGLFVLMRHCGRAKGGEGVVYRAVRRISVLSYGIYLMHILLLNALHPCFASLATPWAILLTGLSTFAACILVASLLERLPARRILLG